MKFKNHKALWLITVLFVIFIFASVSANAEESDAVAIVLEDDPLPSAFYYPNMIQRYLTVYGIDDYYFHSFQKEEYIDNEWVVTFKMSSPYVTGNMILINFTCTQKATKVRVKVHLWDLDNHTADWESGEIDVLKIQIPMETDEYTMIQGQTAYIQYPEDKDCNGVIVRSSPKGIISGQAVYTIDRMYTENVVSISAIESGVADVTLSEYSTGETKTMRITVLKQIDATGWIQIDDKYYYGDTNQRPLTGMAEIDGVSYIFSEIGEMRTGWVEYEGKWYYAQDSGALYNNGWLKIDDTWYYFKSNGEMATGWVFDGYAWYYMNSNGTMTTGWIEDDDKWYYMDDNGAMKTGWIKLDKTWYLLHSNGEMASGWEYLYDKWYYFSSSGGMVTGWQNIEGVWYSFSDSGTMRTGWCEDNTSNWYWFDKNGVMATGWKEINGQWEMFDDNGAWLYTWDGN